MCLSNISGLASALMFSYFRTGRKIFPMGELDTVFKDHFNDVSQTILFTVKDENPTGGGNHLPLCSRCR